MGMWYVVYMYMMYEVKCMKVCSMCCMWYKVCVCGTRYVYVVQGMCMWYKGDRIPL